MEEQAKQLQAEYLGHWWHVLLPDLLEELFECTDILIWVLDGADGNCMRDCQGILKKLAASASRSSAFVTSSRAAVVERIRWCCRVALMSAGRRMAGVGTSASALWSRTTTASTSQGRFIKKFNCEDIDECVAPRSCFQYCTNTTGGFHCCSQPGYRRHSSNYMHCMADSGNPYLISYRAHMSSPETPWVLVEKNEMTVDGLAVWIHGNI
ncbi:uncharacterized protein LOC135102877 [Scylla paramamosain]|uniref:uncharacterized protein LOC135102877 n=1 Tax=Scylla paramamosain TaxID=85552 RepID=UPI0030827CDE